MSLVGKKAPDFVATAVMGDDSINDNFNFHKYLNGSIGIIFFWPSDFTFVCPTEVIAFNNRLKEFEKRGVKVVGCSVDSYSSHQSWKQAPLSQGGVGNIQFPMVSDSTKEITKNYRIISDNGLAYRATFLIDQEGIVVHQVVNNFKIGRNIDETIRMVDALLFVQENGESCPANWEEGEKGMKETKEDTAEYLTENAKDL